MKDLNCVQLIGRLGQDPEVQYTDRVPLARRSASPPTVREPMPTAKRRRQPNGRAAPPGAS